MLRSSMLLPAVALLIISSTGCDAGKQVADAGKQMADAGGGAVQNMADAAQNAAGEIGVDMAGMMSKATEALSGVEGGSEMLKQLTEMFGTATKTFSGVTDAASATAALPELGKLTESFGGMSQKFGALPDVAKGAVAGIFQSSMEQLKPIIDKIMAIPGVEAILKPAVEALMGKLDAFKA